MGKLKNYLKGIREKYLGANNDEDEHKDYQDLIEGRVYNGIIRYNAIEYISQQTGKDMEEIMDFIRYKTGYMIDYGGHPAPKREVD